MAKELPFFKFEISEWMFGRIQKQPESMQGMFINLCCKYWHKLGEYSQEDAGLDFGADRITTLIDNKLIGSDDGYIFIKFLDIQLDECDKTSKKNSIKGLKSAKIRALRKLQLTTVEPRLTTVQPDSTEEKREEEKRGEERRFIAPEIFGTNAEAHKFLTTNHQDLSAAKSVLSNLGWNSVNDVDVGALAFHFCEKTLDITTKPKEDVRKHFQNWLNKVPIGDLQKLSIQTLARHARKQSTQVS